MKTLLATFLLLTFVTSGHAGKKLDEATRAKADKMVWAANAAQGEKDYDRMFEQLEEAARMGHAPAMTRLGELFMYGGEAWPQDPDKAIAWLKKGTATGDLESKRTLANLYFRRHHDEKTKMPYDPAKTIQILKEVIREGKETGNAMSRSRAESDLKMPEHIVAQKKMSDAMTEKDWTRVRRENAEYEAQKAAEKAAAEKAAAEKAKADRIASNKPRWPVGTYLSFQNNQARLVHFDPDESKYSIAVRLPRGGGKFGDGYGFNTHVLTWDEVSRGGYTPIGGVAWCENCGGAGFAVQHHGMKWGFGSPDGNTSNGVLGWKQDAYVEQQACPVCRGSGDAR